ncbi:MAG: TonB-dependent receptor domain-containing protein, partial [Bryobacteraceae bacterium]
MLLVCGAGESCFGQFNGAIQGTVVDQSQSVVPDATVRVVSVSTDVVREAATSADGLYRILSLAPGEYKVIVEKTGFQSMERDSVTVALNETARVDFALNIGSISEKVTVEAAPPLVETEQGRVSGQIDSRELQEMPLNTRNVLNLLALQPGVTGRGLSAGYGTGSPGDSFAGETAPNIYASGQRFEANNYMLDDTSVTSEARPGVTNIVPNPDAVQEVRVVSNNFSAVDGRDTGAQIQMITKPGTNQFHGTAHFYNQNNQLASRNTFEAKTPVFRRNLMGGTFGGPIVKNRTFFFFSYEALRQSGGRAQAVVVETPQLRDYVLRTRPNSIAAQFFSKFQPIANPTSGIRDVGSPGVGPNTLGPPDGIPDVGSATFVPRYQRDGNQFSLRVDHELRPGKDRLYGTGFKTWNDSVNGTIRPAFDLPLNEMTEFLNLNETHVFSPNQLNEFRVGATRLVGTPSTPNNLEIPQIVTPGISMRQLGSWPRGWAQTNYNFKDVYSLIKSSHSLKIGGELRKLYGGAHNTPNYIPQYDFANIMTFVTDSPLQMTRLVDPRTGIPALVDTQLRFNEWALFINDDWKVSRRLTLNIGLRYENYGSMTDKQNSLRNFIFGSGNTYAQRVANGKVDSVSQFYPTDNTNFAPRLGMAWDTRGNAKTVVRAGYGISYDRIPTLPAENYRLNPPFRATAILGYFFGSPTFNYSLGDTSKPYYGYPVDRALQVGLNAQNGINGARVSLQAVDPNLRSPMVHNWL